MESPRKLKIAVIGAGAAGLMAAGYAYELGADVTVFEKTEHTAWKLGITGKGRCNLTNDCDRETFLSNVAVNPRFLYAAISHFSPADTMEFFESRGVRLKTERGNRVFPASDKARDVVFAMRAYAKPCRFIRAKVNALEAEEDGRIAVVTDRRAVFDRVILCTGGASYPSTGSTGDGNPIAEKLGIGCVPLTPSLIPIEIRESFCREMQGLSLKNVAIAAFDGDKKTYEDFGEMMFTHFGVTGPIVLSLSAHLRGHEAQNVRITLDLKPALDKQTLDRRLQNDFAQMPNKNYSNALASLLPAKMIPVFARLSGIDADKKVNLITKKERETIGNLLKCVEMHVKGLRPIEEAIITSGGIDTKEIDPKTMMSKKIPHLYFAGEVIDVDAYTGGFNLQIAWSTARLAAQSAASDE